MDADALAADLIRDEGRRARVYDDATGKEIGPGSVLVGHPTIGIGRALDVKGLSDDEINYLNRNDIVEVAAELDRDLPWWRALSASAQLGLGNMCFQMGISGLLGFKDGLACLKSGDYAGARTAFLDSLWARETPNRASHVIGLFAP